MKNDWFSEQMKVLLKKEETTSAILLARTGTWVTKQKCFACPTPKRVIKCVQPILSHTLKQMFLMQLGANSINNTYQEQFH